MCTKLSSRQQTFAIRLHDQIRGGACDQLQSAIRSSREQQHRLATAPSHMLDFTHGTVCHHSSEPQRLLKTHLFEKCYEHDSFSNLSLLNSHLIFIVLIRCVSIALVTFFLSMYMTISKFSSWVWMRIWIAYSAFHVGVTIKFSSFFPKNTIIQKSPYTRKLLSS